MKNVTAPSSLCGSLSGSFEGVPGGSDSTAEEIRAKGEGGGGGRARKKPVGGTG